MLTCVGVKYAAGAILAGVVLNNSNASRGSNERFPVRVLEEI